MNGDLDIDVDIEFGDTDALGRLQMGPQADHLCHIQALRMQASRSDDILGSLETLEAKSVKLLEHQVDAAHRALFEMDGRALLADEVGLGKTIEVGMILREMHYRDIQGSVLILTPAQLAKQWQTELRTKFKLSFVCNYDDAFEGFGAHDRIIASIDTAKSERHRASVLRKAWDVLVLDEAHYIKNEATDRFDLIEEMDYRYGFFLTATPIQNELTDLYNIISLLRPGLFGTRESFQRRYVDSEQQGLANEPDLHQLLDGVMIRNRREDTDIDFTDRIVDTRTFAPSKREMQLYEAVSEYVSASYERDRGQKLVLMTLQKEVVSSPAALRQTVSKRLADNPGSASRSQLARIMQMCDEIEQPTKQRRLLEIIDEAQASVAKGRVIVFTQFRPTQAQIVDRLVTGDHLVHTFHGGHTSAEKEEIVSRFESTGGVLVATDAMSEGRNLQSCNVLVNYDLPWNPMRVEQRIGRIHRIGQDRDVYIFNLALRGTVEEYVLERLYDKIDLFQKTVGGLSEILSRLQSGERGFEDAVFERLVNADTAVDLQNDFEAMAIDLEEHQELAEKVGAFNSEVFADFDLGV